MSDHDQADVVIVGAGMVGASLAVALRMLQLRVTVIEAAAQKDPQQPSYDDRSTALSYGSRRILEGLGLWPDLSSAATPIHTIHVSDRGRFGATRLTKEELQVPALGYVVENRALGQVLWRAMEAADVDIRCPAKIRTVTPQADSVRLQYAPAAEPVVTLESRLLVAADGLRSPTRQLLGIDTRSNDYGQMAVIANVTPERFHEHVAYERFTSAGPIAFLPLANGRCSVVWTAQPHDAAELCDMDDEDFLAALQKAFGYRLGALQRTGRRQSYPLALVQAGAITGLRHVLIGNAAHGLHPVAGQGFNLGLRDVAALADVIADADDPGGSTGLRSYRQWRQSDHERVIRFTDGLVRLFTSELPPLQFARSAGLQLLDILGPPRAMLARQSMGISGRLPRLSRGVPLR